MIYKPLTYYVENMPCSYGVDKNEADENINVVKVSNVDGKGFFKKNFEKRGFSKKEIGKLLVNKDDLLVVKSSGSKENILSGKTAIVNENLEKKLIVSNFLFRLGPKSNVKARFLWYYLNSRFSKAYIKKVTSGSTYPNLKWESYSKLPIPFFEIDQQESIVRKLDIALSLINKNKQLLAAYNELLQSVFLELFGDPVRNKQNWPVNLLSGVSEVVSGVTKGRKLKKEDVISLPYIRVANVQDGHLDLNEIKTIDVLPKDLEKYRLLPGDILLTEGGDPDKLGRGAVWDGQIEDCIHQNHIFRVRIKDEINLTEDYLSALIGSAYGKRYFLKASKQTTGIASINSTQLKKFPVIMAPMELQRKFKSAIENIEAQKALVKQNIKESENLFNGLVQKAFKGELTDKKERV